MNPIQRICMRLQMCPINGRLDNEPSSDMKSILNPDALGMSIWSIMGPEIEKVFVETMHDVDTDALKKQVLKKAQFHFKGVDAPLVLDTMPAHPAFPRFPQQLFEVEGRELKVKQNPYFKGDIENVFSRTLLLYLALESLAGYNMPKDPIKEVILDNIHQSVSVIHTDKLNPELLKEIEDTLHARFKGNQEAYITHFILNFMPKMLKKTERGFKEIEYEGKKALQNSFGPVSWSEEEKTMSLSKLLHELSMEPTSENCPAYISQGDRLNRYIRTVLQDLIDLPIPLKKEDHGINCDSWDKFYTSTQGIQLIQSYQKSLLKILDDSCFNLGTLIDTYKKLNPAGKAN